MKNSSPLFDKLINWTILFTGAPLCIFAGIWSIINRPILGFGPPDPSVALRLTVLAASTLLATLALKLNRMNKDLQIAVGSLGHYSFVRYGKNQSVAQVGLMLDEVKQLLEDGSADVIIYEAHLEPSPPNRILKSHRDLVDFAVKKGRSLHWEVLVGEKNGEKDEWIEQLKQKVSLASDGRYHVFVLKGTEPSLNFIVIPCINQVYMGLGDWLGGGNTGGVWVKSEHFASAMAAIFRKLKDNIDDQIQ